MENNTISWKTKLYDEKHDFVYKYGASLIDFLKPESHERILDLGCGTGVLASKIREVATDTSGLDKSPEMILKAQQEYPEVSFEVGDASYFKFNNPFDAIFSNATLHWVLDYKNAISCIYNNLNKGGRMVVEFGGKGNVKSIVDTLHEVLAEKGYAKQLKVMPWYFPSISEYTTELEAQGLEVIYAELYVRPTELADESEGITDWLHMFGGSFFERVEAADLEEIKQITQERLKLRLFKNGKWMADYK